MARALKNPFAPIDKIAAEEDWVDDAFDEEDDEGESKSAAREVERLTADLAALEARLLKDQAFDAGEVDAALPQTNRAAPMRRSGAGRAVGIPGSMRPRWRSPQATTRCENACEGRAEAASERDAETIGRRRRAPRRCSSRGDAKGGMAALALAAAADDANDSSKASTVLQLSPPCTAARARYGRGARAPRRENRGAGHRPSLPRRRDGCRGAGEGGGIDPRPRRRNPQGSKTSATSSARSPAAPTSSWRRRRSNAASHFTRCIPFPLARFAELSVDIGDPKGAEGAWRQRFDDVLSRAASLDHRRRRASARPRSRRALLLCFPLHGRPGADARRRCCRRSAG